MRTYNDKEKLKWLKDVYPQFKEKKWHNSPAYHPSDLKYHMFFEGEKIYKQKINPSKIIGIQYGFAYNCPSLRLLKKNNIISWMDLFFELKRLDQVINNFTDKSSLIDHIQNNKSRKAVIKYGNHYITFSGQHRLCLAKLLDLKEVEVQVHEHFLNRTLLLRELRTKKAYKFYVRNNLIIENYDLQKQIKLRHILLKINKTHIFLPKEFQEDFINQYQKIKVNFITSLYYKIFFNNTHYTSTIQTPKDINNLKHLIFVHKSQAITMSNY